MADDEAGPFVTVADGRTFSWRKKPVSVSWKENGHQKEETF